MMAANVIGEFRGVYSFMSNFARVEPGILYKGFLFPSVENAYQADKKFFLSEYAKEGIVDLAAIIRPFVLASSAEAKKLGRIPMPKELLPAWNIRRNQTMYDLLERKFSHPYFADLLIKTGGAQLIGGNYWHDTYWGVCNGACWKKHPEPEGSNVLGSTLMDIREVLQKGVK